MNLGPFFENYLIAVGDTMHPKSFHRWAALSLVAATLENRVWVMSQRQKMFPNLYVMLVGPSGCGKGVSIDFATARWNSQADLAASKRCYRGSLTKQHLIDMMGGRATTLVNGKPVSSKVTPIPTPWLVAPELYHTLGASGQHSEAFIACLTDLYSNSPVPVSDGTRTWGNVVISGHCINWLAGTTAQWLRRSLSPDAIQSGFFGRVAVIEGNYSSEYKKATYPDDIEDRILQIENEICRLKTVNGEFVMTPEAEDVLHQWLSNREVPEDELLRPAYQRDEELVLKLCVILAASDGPVQQITRQHIVRARWLVSEARAAQPSMVALSYSRPQNEGMSFVRDLIRKSGCMSQTTLVKKSWPRGLDSDAIKKITWTLVEAGLVERVKLGQGIGWRWKGSERQWL